MQDLTATLSHVVCQGVQRMRVLDFDALAERATTDADNTSSFAEADSRIHRVDLFDAA